MKMSKQSPEPEVKEKLLAKATRDFNQSVPNGYLGTDVKPVTEARGGISGLIHYLTKQVDQFHPAYEVVDVANSRVDPKPLLHLYQDKRELCGVQPLMAAYA